MRVSNEVRIGIAVLAAAAVLVLGIIYLRGLDLRSQQYSLTVLYKNVTGLKEGDVVTVSGLAVGHVAELTLAGHQIAVNLSIKAKMQLPDDSEAILKSATIMGGKYIEILPGAGARILMNGDSLAGRYEADLSELTSTLAPISGRVLGILENINATLDEPTRKQIQGTISNIAQSSARLQEIILTEGQQADRAFRDFSQFSRDLSNFARTLDSLAQSQGGSVETTLKALKKTSAQVERIAARMDQSSESLQEILANVRKGKGTLGKLAYDEKLYDDIDSLAMNLNFLVKDLRENPGRYLRVSVF